MNKAVKLYEKEYSSGDNATDSKFAVTINLAGKQRMLTQKMTKEFMLIAKGIDVDDNKLNLLETFELFDRTLKGLMLGDETLELDASINTQEIRSQLQKVSILWMQFKPIMDKAARFGKGAITSGDIQHVAKENVPLLKEMNAAVQLFEKASKA